MKRYLLLITLVLIVAPLAIAGCTSPSNPSPSPGTAASTATSSATKTAAATSAAHSTRATASPAGAATTGQKTYTVSIVSYAFQPSTMTVPRGTSVTWRNTASITHTVTSNTGAFNSGNLSPGATFTHQFSQAGTYQYHCNIHPSMTGTIVVQ